METYAVIMAGASRNGLWPLSREACPKPFLARHPGESTYLQDAFNRLERMVPAERILVVTLERYRDMALAQLPQLPRHNLLLEPYGRGTAPCIAFATYEVLSRCKDALLLITPADRTISDSGAFADTLTRALDFAREEDALVTLGVVPTRPDTHFGYIQVKEAVEGDEEGPLKVKTFTEKPDEALAKVFIDSREFFWNTGILLSRASLLRTELERHAPQVTRPFSGWEEALVSPRRDSFLHDAYAAAIHISVDYALLEKTSCAWLFTARFGWGDTNSWETVAEVVPPSDAEGNIVHCDKALLKDTKDSIILSTNAGKLVTVKGLRGYVVIDTPDALMVCPADDASVQGLTSDLGMPGFEKYR